MVRKYTSNAYVIMSNRLSASSTELLQFASGFQKSVLDVHYYNLFTSEFTTMTVQQNIDYVNNNRSADISTVSIANGPLVFVGKSFFFKTNYASKCLNPIVYIMQRVY